jgi:phage/plasmid-like protein (TIGR03299 family)
LNEDAWHGLGNVRGQGDFPDRQPVSMSEAREWAGLDWEPIEGLLYVPSAPRLTLVSSGPPNTLDVELSAILGLQDPVGAAEILSGEVTGETTERFIQVPGWKAVVRSDNGHLLSCARDSYGLATNTDLCDLIEAVMGEVGSEGVLLEGLMSLKDGAQVIGVVRLTDEFKLPGDSSPNLTYATFGTAHDGSAALTVFPSQIRVVCNNTWVAAKGGAEDTWGQGVVIRHTKSIKDRIDQAKKILTGMRDAREEYLELAEELVGIKFAPELEERFVVDFIPAPPETLISDRVANNIQEARDAVRMILSGGNVAGAGIGGTAYGCLMAATEYLDHVRRARSEQTKFRRQMLRQEPLKDKALVIIREIAEEVGV